MRSLKAAPTEVPTRSNGVLGRLSIASELQQTVGSPTPYSFQVAVTFPPVTEMSIERITPASLATIKAGGLTDLSKTTECMGRSGRFPIGPLPSVPLTSFQVTPLSVVRNTRRVRNLE